MMALFWVAAAVAILLLATAGAASAYTPPSAPVVTAPSEGSYEPDGDFALSGTAQPYTTVKVFEARPGDFRLDWVGTAQVDRYGRWSLKLGGVVFGRHSYKARVTDQMSNYSDWSDARTVSVDPPLLLQEQDTTVRQADQGSKQLVQEAEQESLPQGLQDHYAGIWRLSQDLGAHSAFVATMAVGGVSSTEESAAISRHAELEKAVYEMEQRARARLDEMQAINEEMRFILERCASACSAEDRARLDELQQQMDDLSSDGQLDMIQLQSMINKQQNAVDLVTNLVKKWAYLDDAIIRSMTA
jgi:hypothetical protein